MAESQPPPPSESQQDTTDGGSKKAGAGEAEADTWYRMAGVGIEFIVAVGLFAAIGWWLDRSLDTAPWLVIAGCGLGFIIGLRAMIKMAKRSFR